LAFSFRPVAIARCELRPAHADLAALAYRHDPRAGLEIDHLGLVAGGDDADRADLAHAVERI